MENDAWTKRILGYLCMEATTTNKKGEPILVWYTPQIPVPAGPDTLMNLPGMVLEADINMAIQ